MGKGGLAPGGGKPARAKFYHLTQPCVSAKVRYRNGMSLSCCCKIALCICRHLSYMISRTSLKAGLPMFVPGRLGLDLQIVSHEWNTGKMLMLEPGVS